MDATKIIKSGIALMFEFFKLLNRTFSARKKIIPAKGINK